MSSQMSIKKLFLATLVLLSFSIAIPTFAAELNSGNILTTYGCDPSATMCGMVGRGITSIAPDTFSWYTNLQIINLAGNQLTTITSWAFSGLSDLQKLFLSNDSITNIESWAFSGLNKLQFLYLNSNQITSIADGTFAGLSGLQLLNLSLNPNLATIWANVFSGDVSLTGLDLSNHKLTSLGYWVFSGLSNLQTLTLSGNQINNIASWSFVGLNSLQTLSLNNNNLSKISSWALAGLTNLQTLNLYNNQLNIIDSWSFAWLSNLQRLNLFNNNLPSIDSWLFTGLSNLVFLNLASNQITSITSWSLSGLNSLQNINLYSNNLASISSWAFAGLYNLLSLTLSYNQINSISSWMFAWLDNLQDLSLYNNQIESVATGTFDLLTNLSSLDLGNNCATNGLHNIVYAGGNITTLDDANCVQTSPVPSFFSGSLESMGYGPNANGYEQWWYTIWFNDPGVWNKLTIPVLMTSRNPNKYTQPYYQHNVEVQYESWTSVTRSGNAYTGMLNNAELYNTGSTPWGINVVALTRFGALTHEIDFDQNVTVRIPALGKNVWDQLGIYSSEEENLFWPNGPNWIFESTGTVVSYNNNPYIVFTTKHASRWAIGQVTSTQNITPITPTHELNSGNILTTYGCDPSATMCGMVGRWITSIAPDAFSWYTNLQIINLAGNQLTTITSWAFNGLSNLQKLLLGNDSITNIESWAFSGLSNLQFLYLNSNKITNIVDWTFAGLSWLQTLNLSLNPNLAAIWINVFSGDVSLTGLDLSNHKLTSLGNWLFAGLTNLQVLNLSGNQISNIDSQAFTGLNSLQSLTLNNNQLNNIAGWIFSWLSNLQTLALYNNQITNISTWSFAWLNNLQNLTISNNQITNIDSWAFNGLTNLQSLLLYNNSITNISSWLFSGLINVQTINLYNNQITDISTWTFAWLFAGQNNLQNLGLSNNQISYIATGTFDLLTSLSSLDISDNCAINGTEYIEYAWWGATLDDVNCAQTSPAPSFFSGSLENIGYGPNANGYEQWWYTIWFNDPGVWNKLTIPVLMTSRNPNKYTQPYYQHNVEVQYESWTSITRSGNAYTGMLNNAELYNTGSTPWGINVVALTRFGALTHEIDFDQNVTVRIPALGKNVWDQLGIYSSEEGNLFWPNGPNWIFESTGTVVSYNSNPYIVFTTKHASRWAIGQVTSNPIGAIHYDILTTTTQNVTATLSLNEQWVITNNNGSNKYVFTKNGSFTFTFTDLAGNTGSSTATVSWISTQNQWWGWGGWGGGWGWGGYYIPTPPILTLTGIKSTILTPTTNWTGEQTNLSGQKSASESSLLSGVINICSKLSGETNQSYCFAFKIWATTKTTLESAKYNMDIRRSDLAKMVSQYAIKILHKTPNQNMLCNYSDVTSKYDEVKWYIQQACQMGLMWVDNNGKQMTNFRPQGLVTRGEYMTVISRMLYGNKYDISNDEKWKVPFYQHHMDILITKKIFTTTLPKDLTQRYMVFYTLYRLAKEALSLTL